MNTDTELIETKLGLIQLAQQLSKVSQACKLMGYSRDSFYRIKELCDTGGDLALQEIRRRKPIPKDRVEPFLEEGVVNIAIDQPSMGQIRASYELRKKGVFVSSAGVR